MFNKLIFDLTPHSTMRLWAYFDEEDFHAVLNSPVRHAFDYLCCWLSYDKREKGLLSWEFPIELAEFFYNRYSDDPRAHTEFLKRYLGK